MICSSFLHEIYYYIFFRFERPRTIARHNLTPHHRTGNMRRHHTISAISDYLSSKTYTLLKYEREHEEYR
jgi:hypothetical protein